jgi:hypothetical protein
VSTNPTRLLGAALSATLGPAILLNAELEIVVLSDEASALVGPSAKIGASAATALCGNSRKRVLAQAMVEGRAIQTRRQLRERLVMA